MYQVRFSEKALNELKKLDKHTLLLIMAWIKKNLDGCLNPRQQGKVLTANRSGEWRYRVGDYRILAEIDDNTVTILVLSVGHRRNVYDR